MRRSPTEIAAHFLAVAYFTERRGATFGQVRRLADANWPAFLADATAPMGQLLMGKPSPEGRRDFLEAMAHVDGAAKKA